MHEHLLAAGSETPAQGVVAARPVDPGVDEIGDHVDGLLHAEHPHRLVAQEGRDGGHRVALLDHEAGDGEEGGLLAHQRDVGAVQGGDHPRTLRSPTISRAR